MPQWLVDIVGESLAPLLWVAIAALIVIVLAVLIMLLARKALGGSIGGSPRSRAPRLAVMDVASIDQKRRLVLIRRDEVEHLVLVGGQNDLVVESSILRVPGPARARNDSAPREIEESDTADSSILDRIMMSRPGRAAAPAQPADLHPARSPVAAAARQPEQQPNEARRIAPVVATPARSASHSSDARIATPPVSMPARTAPAPRPDPAPVASAPPQTRAPAFATPNPSRPQPVRQAPPVSPAEPPQRALGAVQPRSLATPTVPMAPVALSRPDGMKSVSLDSRDGQSRSVDGGPVAAGPLNASEPAPQSRQGMDTASPPDLSSRFATGFPPLAGAAVGGGTGVTRETDRDARQPAVSAPAVAQVASVRSFASVIQSRQGTSGRPAGPGPLPSAPVKAPEYSTAGEDARAESDLDELLTAELRTEFGRDEFAEARENRPVPSEPTRPEPRLQEGERPAKDRPLTLEEEMERLLGDFTRDMSDRHAG